MKLGLMLGYSGKRLSIDMDLVKEAESLGYHSVWTAEAWGSDALTPLAWIAAQTSTIKLGTGIMQIPGRSPANAAMSAMTLDALSDGRFIMGLGTSGPQVVEGWHGQPFSKPLTWMREYIDIVRQIFRREAPMSYDGVKYQIPFKGPGSTGQGKPLKSILHGRPDIPIFTGSMAPKSQAMSAELGDGCLLTCMHPEHSEVSEVNFRRGLAKAGKTRDQFTLAPTIAVAIGDDLDRLRYPLKAQLALYIGGMGSKKKNFYKDYICKVGFEAEAEAIQDRFLSGDRNGAIGLVPDELVDAVHLIGSKERIRDQLDIWKESSADLLLIGAVDAASLRTVAELAL